IIGPITLDRPVRSSNAAHRRLSTPIPVLPSARATRVSHDPSVSKRYGRRQQLNTPMANACPVQLQRSRRRTGGDGAVGVVDSAMARTEEELCARLPCHRTTQMLAVFRKGRKARG